MTASPTSSPLTHPLAFIGGGNMARSLIGGLLKRGADPTRIRVAEPADALRAALAADFGVQVGRRSLGWLLLLSLALGVVGLAFAGLWYMVYRDPHHSRAANQAELDHITAGGGVACWAATRSLMPCSFMWLYHTTPLRKWEQQGGCDCVR